ncbi:MAG TPA: metallophosphoesterase [Gemmatimonadales bacterium]|nr:metallophosphoesterase [Gemmatimonadales bacterium]
MAMIDGRVRIAALGDLHHGRTGQTLNVPALLARVAEDADLLLLCGDLTDTGLPEEARALAKELAGLMLPVVGVLGNHDYESGRADELKRIFADAGVTILDGEAYEVLGVGIAGVKGFAGGFGRRALGPWGEEAIKRFVHEALDEALKLESALARLRSEPRVVLLHYAPIQGTVEGEPPEIYAFLGSSRLEEPLSRYPVDAVFHGHAHHGQPEGRTMGGVPVYNVSIALLQRTFPDRPPFRLLELPVRLAKGS